MSETLSKKEAEDLFNSSGTEINSKEDAVNAFNSGGTEVPTENHNILQNIANTAKSTVNSLGSGITDAAKSEFTKGIGEDLLDTSRGIGQGLTLGAGDEIGGLLSAPVEALYNRFNPTDVKLREQGFDIKQPGLKDLYRKNQQDIQKELEMSQDRSPYAYTIGQLAGGVTSGSAIGGALGIGGEAAGNAPKLLDIARNEGKMKALGELGLRGLKSYKQALPTIALEGALSSKEGGVTSTEELSKLAEDTAGSALFGLPAVMGLQAATEVGMPLAREASQGLKNKISGAVEENPLLRQMKIAYGYGTKGINPKSQSATLDTSLAGGTKISGLDNERTTALMNEIQEADKRVGQAVGKSLNDATTAGKMINVNQDTKDALSQVQSLATKYPDLEQNSKAAQIFGKIAQTNGNITPNDAQDLIHYMDAYIGKFKAATNKTPLEEGILSNLFQTRKQFSNTLKSQVPEYATAADRFQSFRNLVPETIIAGTRPVDVTNQMYGNIKNQDQSLFDPLKKLIQGTTRQGTSAAPTQQSFYNTMQGMKTFEQQEAERVTSGAIKAGEEAFQRPISAIESQIKKHSDDAVARGAMDALDPHTGVSNMMKQIATGTGDTGRSIALSAANLSGRVSNKMGSNFTKNSVAQMSKAIYNAPSETVSALSRTLKAQPGLEKYGQNLEHALASPDQNRRNQVLFTIMQNPAARSFVDQHSQEETNNKVPQE